MKAITPDSKQKCKESWSKFSREIKVAFVAIGKERGVIPSNKDELNPFLKDKVDTILNDKQMKKSYVEKMENQSEEIIKPSFSLRFIAKFCSEKLFSSTEDTNSDYNLMLATPDFATFRMCINLTEHRGVKKISKVFMHDRIKTNLKFYMNSNILKDIMRQDPNYPNNSRPFIPIENNVLTMDCCKLLHKTIITGHDLKKQKSHIKIRMLVN